MSTSPTKPGSWRMPAETAEQERVWMGFPPADLYPREDPECARQAWSAVANVISEFEPVTMLVDPRDRARAHTYLSRGVELVEAPMDDAWLRDTGPTFVIDEAGELGAVQWVFNGWGQQPWTRWDLDAGIGRAVSGLTGATPVRSPLVNEGGGFHVDGRGTVLLTETVQLDPLRNPGLTKADVEAELARTIGATHAVWLPRGLHRDTETYGTKGHVDMVATFPSPGRLLVHVQNDAAHPDHAITRLILSRLRESHDAAGEAFDIVELPAPTTLRDDEGWVDYSYVNHLVVNGGVVACGFDDPHDADARAILADAYPGREVVMVDARPILARGGGIHCITQQQPKVVVR